MEVNHIVRYTVKVFGLPLHWHELVTTGAHKAKSIAGHAYHRPFIKAVQVKSTAGDEILYLDKTKNGTVRRNVPTE